jgi:hypothetical protein
MWYDREITEKLTFLASKFPVLLVTGARQVGKSSLLQRLFPKHTYVSLDVPSIAESAEKSPDAFFAQFSEPLLIDEIQYAPGLFRFLKQRVDKSRHTMGRFILTGSQKFALMQSVSDSLAGRCAIVDLEGLSFHELARVGGFPASPDAVSRVITRGSFPELWRDPEIPAPVFYNSYLATYLERDVRQILNVTNLRDFERFMRACAARTAQLLDKNALANDVGVSSKAISSWLNVLVASNQIVLLEPWFSNIGKRLVKSPKLYFNDTGLASHLLGISPDTFAASPFVGPLWENAVFGEIRRYLSLCRRSVSVWYYRDNQQREIDFMVLAGGKAALLECKWAERPDEAATKSITELQKLAREKKIADLTDTRGFVVCRTPHQFPLGKSPVHAISLEHLRENLERTLSGNVAE